MDKKLMIKELRKEIVSRFEKIDWTDFFESNLEIVDKGLMLKTNLRFFVI